MSRKHKPHAPLSPSATTPATDVAPDEVARAALAASRFKEAIEQYKALLKAERRPEWIAALAEAYAGRAEQCAAKGMIKEAIALWRTRAEACATPLIGGPYVKWLLQGGQAEQVFALLEDQRSLAPEVRERIENELAAAVLVAPDAWIARLAPDMPLVRHRAAALAALAAAAADDETALAQALNAIAFRSPYRDLRPLLRAMALLRSDRQQAAAMLERCAGGGPFEPLAAALRVAAAPSHAWLGAMRGLDDAARHFVLDITGCPEPLRALVTDLARAGGDPHALFDAVARHRRTMPAAQARALALRLLPHAPQRLGAFQSTFGSLSVPDRDHVMALAAEVKQNHESARRHWLDLAFEWSNDPAHRRRAAMVLRHLAGNRHFCEADSDASPESPALDWLAQSLDLDPDDREAELRLLRGLRERGDLRATRERLDAAMERFAGDTAVLLEAVQTALAGGAFKKAIGLAKRVLAIDPINPQVRNLIGQAHLSHARKQIAARRRTSAQRELDQAGSWLRGSAELAIADVLRALAAEVPADADPLLRQALVDLGAAPLAMLRVGVEATRVGFDASEVLRRAGARLDGVPGPAEVLALAQALNSLRADDSAVRAALEPLAPMLQRAAAQLQSSESDLALICEALHRHGKLDLLRRFASQALRHWPDRPAFVYFDVVARHAPRLRQIPPHERERLEHVCDRAQEQGDQRTATRIANLLAQAGGFEGGGGVPSLPRDMNPRAALEAIIELGGEREILEVAKDALGRGEYDRLRREIGGNDRQFAHALLQIVTADLPAPSGAAARAARGDPQPRAQPPDDRQRGLFDD